MKIVHVVEPFASGIATFVKSLVENMPDDLHIIVHGEREHLISSAEVKQRFTKGNVRFIRWKSAQRELNFRKDTAAFMELYSILKRLKNKVHIDAVHLHSSKSGFLGRVACKMAGIDSVVYTPNGAPFFVSSSRFTNYFYKQLERLGSIFGGRVVCCSPSEWNAYKSIGITALKINNGISVDDPLTFPLPRLSFSGEPVNAPILKQGKFRIVTSGRIEDQKNPAFFNSIARYFEEFRDVEFLWIGEGGNRSMLSASNIVITGWLSTEETKELIAQSQVYLSTSNFEGMPFAVLEALALKKPVLLTDCVGNRDIVNKRANGDLFTTVDEAIIKILQYQNNRDMLDVMGEYSHKHCEQEFDVYSTSTSYRSLYKS